MTYDLFLGDYAYSSWSLRAWLLVDRFAIPANRTMVWMGGDESVADQLARLAPPARTVPTLRTPEGAVIGESLAIAEELATRHPDAGLWPKDPKARATARALTAEMHAGFTALRSHCPMNLRLAYTGYTPPPDVLADLTRLDQIWAQARAETGGTGPWLCGDYSVADAFFAPVAARIAGFGLPISDSGRAYVMAHLADPSFRRCRAMGLVRGKTLPWYAQDLETIDWPGPPPAPAKALAATTTSSSGPSVNDACPYSGKSVTNFLEYDGRVWGFCNPFCRDKTVADPTAWDAFVAMTTSA